MLNISFMLNMRIKYCFILSIILISCNSGQNSENQKKELEDQKKELELKARELLIKEKDQLQSNCIVLISKELKENVKKIIDATTYGFGSFIIDLSMDQSLQDSIIISPVIKDLKEDLNDKTMDELKMIKTNKVRRYAIVANSIYTSSKSTGNKVTDKIRSLLINHYKKTN